MADKKISQLTASTTPLAGTEVLPIVQSGSTVKVAVSDLTAGRAVSAASLALTGSALPVGSGGTGTATAFATGSVIFSGAAGVYSEDNGQLFWDNTNNRLGIGNSTPAQMLDVTGVGRFGSLGSKINIGLNGDSISSDADMYVQTSTANFISFRTNFTEAIRLETNQNVKVTNGNLVIGTAGKGIDFSANTHAAGMTSELLNDYEEGNWTPVLHRETGGAITASYNTQTGKYVKVGNLVTVSGFVDVASVSAQGSGANEIKGLPYAPANNTLDAGSVSRNNAFTTDVVHSCFGWSDGRILFSSNVNSNAATAVDWKAGFVNFTFSYFV